MKAILKVAMSVAALSMTSPASAATFIFESDDWSEGATFNGRFTVKNVVELAEGFQWYTFNLTRFHAEFSGNSYVGPLTFNLSHVRYFDYSFDGNIGEDRTYADPYIDVWGEYGDPDYMHLESDIGYFYIGSGDCHLGQDCGFIRDKRVIEGYDENHSSLRVTAVPEPATWTLLLLGFGSVGAMFRRRNKALRVA